MCTQLAYMWTCSCSPRVVIVLCRSYKDAEAKGRPVEQCTGTNRHSVQFNAGMRCPKCRHSKEESDEDIVWRQGNVFLKEAFVYKGNALK